MDVRPSIPSANREARGGADSHAGGIGLARRGRTFPAACVAAVVLGLLAAASAGAYTVKNSGYTGSTEVPATYGHRSVAYGAQMFMPTRKVCTTNAYRATQRIQVTYRDYKWLNGRWQLYGYDDLLHSKPTYTETWNVRSGGCTNIPGNGANGVRWVVADWDPYVIGGNGGYFSSDITFRWYKASNGAYLGQRYIDYSGRDYVCDSPQGNFCATGIGWVRLTGFTGAGNPPAGPRGAPPRPHARKAPPGAASQSPASAARPGGTAG